MTPEELEKMAFDGLPMPDLRSQAEILLFLSFRNLYDFAKRVQMTAEQGGREKAEILNAFRVNKFLEELQESTNQMWAQLETAAAAYNQNPSIENADRIMKVLYKTSRKVRKNEQT